MKTTPVDESAAPADSRQPPWPCPCPVCETAAGTSAAYFQRAFGEPHHLPAAADAIADALGFCPRHGAELLQRPPLRQATARAFERVLPRVAPLLTESRFGDEQFQQVYFAAPHACPACSFQHRAVARHASRLARLVAGGGPAASEADSVCHAHFQLLARVLQPELRMPALDGHAHRLDAAARALAASPPGHAAADAEPSPALLQALALCGCAVRSGDAAAAAPLANALAACPDQGHAMASAQACSVCVEVERARRRWLETAAFAVAHGLDDWLFLPICPEHVALMSATSANDVKARVAVHALQVAGEQTHQQLRALVRSAESKAEQAAAAIVRWGRRPRRRKTEAPPPPAPRIARCAACERLAIAELHAVGRLLRLLRDPRQRDAFQAGYGLCMKHHAQAYLLEPRGAVRTLLAHDQARRLADFRQRIEDEKSLLLDPARSAPGPEYLLELRRFCGFR